MLARYVVSDITLITLTFLFYSICQHNKKKPTNHNKVQQNKKIKHKISYLMATLMIVYNPIVIPQPYLTATMARDCGLHPHKSHPLALAARN